MLFAEWADFREGTVFTASVTLYNHTVLLPPEDRGKECTLPDHTPIVHNNDVNDLYNLIAAGHATDIYA